MSDLELAVEPFAKAWAEAKPLAEAHFSEVDGGVEPRRPFALDEQMMQKLEDMGCLLIITARKSGLLAGYFTWQIAFDPESEGLLVAFQGAWYTAPGHPRAAHAMFIRSIEELRSRGVKNIFPHHRLQGRGKSIGRFLERRGAKAIQVTYSLWIGEDEVDG